VIAEEVFRTTMTDEKYCLLRHDTCCFLIYLLFEDGDSTFLHEELFQMNADVHWVNTIHRHCLHKPVVNLSCFQKSAYYYYLFLTANGFSPGGSGTTIRHYTQTTHVTQNNTTIKRNTVHETTHTINTLHRMKIQQSQLQLYKVVLI
jgi:hypothetical protein